MVVNGIRLPYIPETYVRDDLPGFILWHAPDEPSGRVGNLKAWTEFAAAFVREALQWRLRRALHVCCFRDNESARHALERDVSPSMALAPYADEHAGLIVVQSPDADPRNGSRPRMIRLLAHEAAHQLVLDVTDSRKILGDGNRHRLTPPWLDEGFAERLAHLAAADDEGLVRLEKTFESEVERFTFAELDRHLDDLGSPARSAAFVHATAAVRRLLRRFGVAGGFRELPPLSRIAWDGRLCSPENLDLVSLRDVLTFVDAPEANA